MPEVGVSRQPMILSREDLPEPEAPRIVTNSPWPMVKEMSFSAGTGVPSPRV